MNIINGVSGSTPMDLSEPSEPQKTKKRKAKNILSQEEAKRAKSGSKLSLGLPSELIGAIVDYSLFREAIIFRDSVDFDNSMQAQAPFNACRLSPYSRAELMDLIERNWNLPEKPEHEESRYLISRYLQEAIDAEERTQFFQTMEILFKRSKSPEKFFEYLLTALPENLPSLDLNPFSEVVTNKHLRLICKRFTHLRELSLFHCIKISPAGFLLNEPNVQNWRKLNLQHCQINVSFLGLLAKKIPELEELHLHEDQLDGKDHLSLSHFKELRSLYLAEDGSRPCWERKPINIKRLTFIIQKLRTLQVLHLRTDVLSDVLNKLLESCHGLKETYLHLHFKLPEELIHSSAMSKLKELCLSQIKESGESFVTLFQNRSLSQLEKLQLTYCPIPDNAIAALAENPSLQNLRVLRLYDSCRTLKSITSIGNSKHLINLRTLCIKIIDYERRKSMDEGLIAIAQNINFSNLVDLSLLYCNFTEEGAKAFANSPYMRNIRHLTFSPMRQSKPFSIIVNSPHYQLESFGYCPKEAVKAIASCPAMSNLRKLSIGSNTLNDQSVAAIAESPYFQNLEVLHYTSDHLTDEAAKSLANSPYMTRLKSIGTLGPNITDAAVEAIARSPYLRSLTHVSFRGRRYHWLKEIAGVSVSQNPQAFLCDQVD